MMGSGVSYLAAESPGCESSRQSDLCFYWTSHWSPNHPERNKNTHTLTWNQHTGWADCMNNVRKEEHIINWRKYSDYFDSKNYYTNKSIRRSQQSHHTVLGLKSSHIINTGRPAHTFPFKPKRQNTFLSTLSSKNFNWISLLKISPPDLF